MRDKNDLASLLARCGGPKAPSSSSSKNNKRGPAASSGLCLVLVTPKPETPSLWKALSLAYDGAVAFGAARKKGGAGADDPATQLLTAARQANATAAGLADAAAGDSDARVVAVCNGDLEGGGAEMYTGKLKSDALRRFLRGFADGKKCREKVLAKLTAKTDLSAMSVGQLRAAAEARGVTCDGGCLEKADYIRVLKESLSGGGAKTEL